MTRPGMQAVRGVAIRRGARPAVSSPVRARISARTGCRPLAPPTSTRNSRSGTQQPESPDNPGEPRRRLRDRLARQTRSDLAVWMVGVVNEIDRVGRGTYGLLLDLL